MLPSRDEIEEEETVELLDGGATSTEEGDSRGVDKEGGSAGSAGNAPKAALLVLLIILVVSCFTFLVR